MFIDFARANIQARYHLLTSSVVPRPIAWVSSMSKEGKANLAPFSFFNAVCSEPPIVVFCPGVKALQKADESMEFVEKDTLRNIKEQGQFVINVVNFDMAEKMNATSGDYPPEVDEFRACGLTTVPSQMVQPLGVKESPVRLECRLYQHIAVGEGLGSGNMILGEVLCMHIADAILDSKSRIDSQALDAIGRLGGNFYTRTRDIFSLTRPSL